MEINDTMIQENREHELFFTQHVSRITFCSVESRPQLEKEISAGYRSASKPPTVEPTVIGVGIG